MADMWVLAGQSNMEGVGDLVDVETPSPRVRLFAHGDEWKQAEEPLHWLLEANDEVHQMGLTGAELERARLDTRRDRNKGAGLGLAFAKKLVARANVDVDLIPCAHGGTSMEQWDYGKEGIERSVAVRRDIAPGSAGARDQRGQQVARHSVVPGRKRCRSQYIAALPQPYARADFGIPCGF